MEFYNDIVQVIYAFFVVLQLFFIYFMAIIWHELGHWVAFLAATKKFIKIRMKGLKILAGCQEDYKQLKKQQYIVITFTGVLMGLLVMYFLIDIVDLESFIVYFVMSCVYLWGSRSDIKELSRLARGEK